jgi:hypothetical protein
MVVDTTEISKTIQDQVKDFVSRYGDYDNQLQKYYVSDEETQKNLSQQKYNIELENQRKLKNQRYNLLKKLNDKKRYEQYLKNAVNLNKKREKMYLNKLNKLSLYPTKTQIIRINREEYELKNYRILQISSTIYFLLFNIFTSLLFKLNLISKNIFIGIFVISFLYLLFKIYINKPFIQAYGEFSEDTLKSGIGGLVSSIGPIKKCPTECSSKTENNDYYGE